MIQCGARFEKTYNFGNLVWLQMAAEKFGDVAMRKDFHD
jgi:hypothetical protein